MSAGATGWTPVRLIVPGIVLAAAIGYLIWAYAVEARARDFPVMVGWVFVLLALVDVAAHSNSALGRYLAAVLSGRPLDASPAEDSDHAPGNPIVAILWVAGFVGLSWIAGFLVSIPIYVFLFMRLQGRHGSAASLLAAAAMVGVVWGGFELLLRYDVYRGVFFDTL